MIFDMNFNESKYIFKDFIKQTYIYKTNLDKIKHVIRNVKFIQTRFRMRFHQRRQRMIKFKNHWFSVLFELENRAIDL